MAPFPSAPSHLANFFVRDREDYFQDMNEMEWRGQIISSLGNRKFQILYYGDLFEEDGLITGTDFAPALVYAVDIKTGEKILLFDGCRHGYNALFCDRFEPGQLNRQALYEYTDRTGATVFDILLTVYHHLDYDAELSHFRNENGMIQLITGEEITEDTWRRDAFDFMGITLINEKGEPIEILGEELA